MTERGVHPEVLDARQPPGSVVRLAGGEIPAFLGRKLSPHQIGLADLLSVACLRDLAPRETVLIGVQPASLETELNLSTTVRAQLPSIIDMVVEELNRWGYTIRGQS